MSPRLLVPILAALLAPLSACELPRPETPAGAYHQSMTVLMQDNMALAKDLQKLAADVKKDAADPGVVAEQIEKQVLPGARSLAERAAAIEPGSPALAEVHPLIVDAWQARVGVYEDTLSAWQKGDAEAIAAATRRRHMAARQEDRYFDRVNAVLVPEGFVLEPFPAPGAAAAEAPAGAPATPEAQDTNAE